MRRVFFRNGQLGAKYRNRAFLSGGVDSSSALWTMIFSVVGLITIGPDEELLATN